MRRLLAHGMHKELVATDTNGSPVDATSPRAVLFSLEGTILRVVPPLLAIAALEHVAGHDIPSIQHRSSHSTLLAIIDDATTWLEHWE